MTCYQKGKPACPFLYEEDWYEPKPEYVLVNTFESYAPTMALQEKAKRLIGYHQRLHIGLAGCRLGIDHEGGHLVDTRHGRVRVWIEDESDDKCPACGADVWPEPFNIYACSKCEWVGNRADLDRKDRNGG
jgi:hypothetical protein